MKAKIILCLGLGFLCGVAAEKTAYRPIDTVSPASSQTEVSLPTIEHVMSWQEELQRLGYYKGKIDGVFGTESRKALEAHQGDMFYRRCLKIEVKK